MAGIVYHLAIDVASREVWIRMGADRMIVWGFGPFWRRFRFTRTSAELAEGIEEFGKNMRDEGGCECAFEVED